MSPPLGCLEPDMQLREPCFVNSGSWNYQSLSLGLSNPQSFFLKDIFLSRVSVKRRETRKNHLAGNLSRELPLRDPFHWVYALIYIVYCVL